MAELARKAAFSRSKEISPPRSKKSSTARLDRGSVLTEAVLRSAGHLGLSRQQLADSIGVSKADISRFENKEDALKDGSMPFKLAVLLVRAFCSLDDIAHGDKKTVREWMKAKNSTLDGRPIDLITKVEGLIDVEAYLDVRRAPV